MTKNLFSDFQRYGKSDWIEKAIQDLKGTASFNKLVQKSEEGFEVFPFYTKEDLQGKDYLRRFNHILLNEENPALENRHWDYLEKIDVRDEKEANTKALEVLNKGADGILFNLLNEKPTDLVKLLNYILIDFCPVYIKVNYFDKRLNFDFLDYLSTHAENKNQLNGGILYDPISDYAETGHIDGFSKDYNECIKTSFKYPGTRTVSINAEVYHNSGGSVSQELGCILSTLVFYLDHFTDEGFSVSDVFSKLHISVACGTNYFHEIAKIKALRILCYKIAESYGLKELDPSQILIQSNSSMWNRSVIDPYVNILRFTTEAMSSILGGCNTLCLTRFDTDIKAAGDFSERISRNISSILKDESYFGKVADPSAGSYYIETLVDELIKSGWTQFLLLEENGGIKKSLEKGYLQYEIRKNRDLRLKKIAERKISIIGTNKYPQSDEQIIIQEKPENRNNLNFEVLKPQRASSDFEHLRLALKAKEKPPKILVIKFGNHVMQRLRAAFTVEFFASAGLSIAEQVVLDNMENIEDTIISANCEIIVLCASDEDYLEKAEDIAKKIKSKRTFKQLVLAGHPKEKAEIYLSAGFDAFIYLGCNVIETINSIILHLDQEKGRSSL